ERILERLADLAERGARAGRLDRSSQQVAVAARGLAQVLESAHGGASVAAALEVGQPRDLLLAHLRVVDLAHLDRLLIVEPEAVDADDHVLAAVDAGLPQGSRLLDLELGRSLLHRPRHAA